MTGHFRRAGSCRAGGFVALRYADRPVWAVPSHAASAPALGARLGVEEPLVLDGSILYWNSLTVWFSIVATEQVFDQTGCAQPGPPRGRPGCRSAGG